MLGVSHTAVIYWVKKAGEKIKDIAFEERKPEKVDVMELDEMCVNLKKSNKKWIWLAVERASQKIRGFYVGSRETSSFEKLSQIIQRLNVETYATDAWESYNLIDPKKHIVGKAHTYTLRAY